MTHTSSQHARLRFLRLSATVVAAVLLLAGCSVPFAADVSDTDVQGSSSSDSSGSKSQKDDATDDNAVATPGKHQVRLTMTGWAFDFTPTTCVNTDGVLRVSGLGVADESLRATGPGVNENDPTDETNFPAFLDIDIGEVDGWPAGKIFVYFFATDAAPTDEYIQAEVGGGGDYSMGDVLNGYELQVVIKSRDGTAIDTGTFMINCG